MTVSKCKFNEKIIVGSIMPKILFEKEILNSEVV